MDVSALTGQLSSGVAATVIATTPAAKAPERSATEAAERAPSPTPRFGPASVHHVDVSRALAERVVANIDKPSSGAPAPAASELWIPTWVRAAYAARARRGWFLPPPTTLAGYTNED